MVMQFQTLFQSLSGLTPDLNVEMAAFKEISFYDNV